MRTARAGIAFAALVRGRGRDKTVIVAAVFGRDRLTGQAFDVAEVGLFLAVNERDRNAFGTGARGAANTMNVAFRHIGEFVVHDVADAIDVDAAGGDVGCDQDADLAALEAVEGCFALVLALVAMDGGRRNAGCFQVAGDLVGAALRAGEDQDAR